MWKLKMKLSFLHHQENEEFIQFGNRFRDGKLTELYEDLLNKVFSET